LDNLKKVLSEQIESDTDAFNVVDDKGNIVATINGEGIRSTKFITHGSSADEVVLGDGSTKPLSEIGGSTDSGGSETIIIPISASGGTLTAEQLASVKATPEKCVLSITETSSTIYLNFSRSMAYGDTFAYFNTDMGIYAVSVYPSTGKYTVAKYDNASDMMLGDGTMRPLTDVISTPGSTWLAGSSESNTWEQVLTIPVSTCARIITIYGFEARERGDIIVNTSSANESAGVITRVRGEAGYWGAQILNCTVCVPANTRYYLWMYNMSSSYVIDWDMFRQ
jgi:hypothetical protein